MSEQWGIRSVVKRKTSIDRTGLRRSFSAREKKKKLIFFFPFVLPLQQVRSIKFFISIGVIVTCSESAAVEGSGWVGVKVREEEGRVRIEEKRIQYVKEGTESAKELTKQ